MIDIEQTSRKASPKLGGSGGRFLGLAQDIGGRVGWAARVYNPAGQNPIVRQEVSLSKASCI